MIVIVNMIRSALLMSLAHAAAYESMRLHVVDWPRSLVFYDEANLLAVHARAVRRSR